MAAANEELTTVVMQNKRVWEETVRDNTSMQIAKAIVIPAGPSPIVEEALQATEKKKKAKRAKKVMVLNQPLLHVARIAAEKGLNPLVVDAGNNNDPIKIVESGAIGTESDILRRSNLGSALASDTHYPLSAGNTLYAADVTVFKGANYSAMRPFKINVLVVPPVSRPMLVSVRTDDGVRDDYNNPAERDRMQASINKMFEVALLKGHRCIVVDDFGCSAASNPINSVIDMFNVAIAKYPIGYVFFAITEPPSFGRSSGTSGSGKKTEYKNYTAFNRYIERPGVDA